MKAITRVEIINFQSHSNTVVEFDEKFNAIVGETDNGKTSIFRAMRWCLYNKPSGTSFIRKGTSECSVTIHFNDGTMIKRYRSKTTNAYDVIMKDGTVKEGLTGFGVGVPTEVLQTHEMRPVHLGVDGKRRSLNLSQQLDGPFLLSEGPTQKATVIGRIAHTEAIDKAIKGTTKDTRDTKSKIEDIISDIKEAKEGIKRFDDIEAREELISKAERLLSEIESELDTLNKARHLLLKINNEKLRKQNLQKIMDNNRVWNDILEAVDELQNEFNSYHNIKVLLSKIKAENERLKECRDDLNKYSDCANILDEINRLKEEIDNHNVIRNKIRSRNNLLNQITQLETVVDRYKNSSQIIGIAEDILNMIRDYKSAKTIYNKLGEQKLRRTKGEKIIQDLKDDLDRTIEEYKQTIQMVGKCPTCFRDVDKNTLDIISSNLF